MRLFSATLATETNTFSPLPTSIEGYKEGVWLRPGEHPADAPRMCTATLFVARQRAKVDNFTLIEGSCFAASPAGTTNRADYETMRDEILGQLRQALPLDGVVLGLHGAMVAHGYDDVEGDIIERVLQDIEDKKINPGREFSEAGVNEISELHGRLINNLRLGMSVFLNGDLRDAQRRPVGCRTPGAAARADALDRQSGKASSRYLNLGLPIGQRVSRCACGIVCRRRGRSPCRVVESPEGVGGLGRAERKTHRFLDRAEGGRDREGRDREGK